MDERTTRAPASGEVAAISGFMKQYEYSACVLLKLMQRGELEAITVSDPAAGMFDDLVVHSKGCVLAIQVKTQKDARYTLLGTELKQALLRDMVDAWRSLEDKFGVDKVRLRYIFAGLFSVSDTSLANDGEMGASNSAAFASFLTNEIVYSDLAASPWSSWLGELQILSGLEPGEFARFLSCLELRDERELLANRVENFAPEDQIRAETLRNQFPIMIKSSTPGRNWSEQDIVSALGWRNRLTQYNTHVFPVPEDVQSNDATSKRLLDALARTTGGYISLLGPPGMGKSTLLQHGVHSTVEYSVGRYLAFHPGQRQGLGRAEAAEFLNDVVVELGSSGLSGSRFGTDSLILMRAEFRRLLDVAAKRFSDTGRKTVMIVDGLDHVSREETPRDNFLAELPAAGAVPDGVIFVLGSQSLDLPGLAPTIVQQAKHKDRRIDIEPLSRAAVFEMANIAGLSRNVDREELYTACSGHPLTTRYFIEALAGEIDDAESSRILSLESGLGHTLQDIYERVWQGVGVDRGAKDALAVLARAEGSLLPEQLADICSEEPVDTILKAARFLLFVGADRRISIFHNSFRLFVAGQTNKKFDVFDADLEAGFHSRLADMARGAAEGDPQSWFELRYRSRAGDEAGALELGTADYFRSALKAFRPATEVYGDLRLTYGAVGSTGDRVLLLNKLLIEKEMDYRLDALSQTDFAEVLFELGNTELATKHALESTGEKKGWLLLVDHFWARGDTELARQIFEANEPLDILFADRDFIEVTDLALACDWIRTAQRFRSLERLMDIAEQIERRTAGDRTVFHNERHIRQRLAHNMALGRLLDRPETDVDDLRATLRLDEADLAQLLIDHVLALNQADKDLEVAALLVRLDSMAAVDDLHESWRRSLALVAIARGSMQLGARLTKTLQMPRLENADLAPEDFEDHVFAIIETARLSSATGVTVPEEGPGRNHEKSEVLKIANTKLRELGILESGSVGGATVPQFQSLRSLLLFFAHASTEGHDYRVGLIFRVLPKLARNFVRIAESTGPEQFRRFVDFMDGEFAREGSNLAAEEFRVAMVEQIFRVDGRRDDAERRLIEATRSTGTERTPHDAVESHIRFARAFNHVGLQQPAWTALRAMHDDTFGYWLRAKKEPQYIFWSWAFAGACRAEPQSIEERAKTFAQFLLGMEHTEGEETAKRVVIPLLKGATGAPSTAAGIFVRLLDSDLASWETMVDAVLASIVEQEPKLAGAAVSVYARLVVPFASGDATTFMKACLPAMAPSERRDAVLFLRDHVLRWCPPASRAILVDELKAFLPDPHEASSLDDPTSGALASLLRKGRDRDDDEDGPGHKRNMGAANLDELAARGDGASTYGDGVDVTYASAAAALIEHSSTQEIRRFLQKRPLLLRSAPVMTTASRRLMSLGDTTGAREIFQLAEQLAQSGHWGTFWGGEKLALQRARIQIEGESAYDRGFEVVTAELATGRTYGGGLFLNLGEVLEAITKNLPFGPIWSETESHLRQYREFRLAQPVTTMPSVHSQFDLLAFIVAQAFALSCGEVQRHARAAAESIGRGPGGADFIEKLFHFVSAGKDGPREIANLVNRLRQVPQLRQVLVAQAGICAQSDDFVVASLAAHAFPDIEFGGRDNKLPAFYSLVAESDPRAADFKTPPGFDTPKGAIWTDDPWNWTSGMGLQFRLLSQASGIDLAHLRRRCAIFMRQEGGRLAFGPEVENAVRAKLIRLGLRLPYRRQMTAAALRAFGRVVRELDDAERLDRRCLPLLWTYMGGPTLSALPPEMVTRPDWVVPPRVARSEFGQIEQKTWLIHTDDDLLVPTVPDMHVLAEESYVRLQTSSTTVEATKTILPQVGDGVDVMARIPAVVSLDTLAPGYGFEDSILVCRIEADVFGDLPQDALTVCPYVIEALGWHRSPDDVFKVFDSDDELVADTVRWIDGTDMPQSYDDTVAAVGNAVLLTDLGLRQLEAIYGEIALQVSFERSAAGGTKRASRQITLT